MVYLLEVDYGMGFELESVWANEHGATQAGEQVVTHSASYVKYRVRSAPVRS